MDSVYRANPQYDPEVYYRCLSCPSLLAHRCDGPNLLAMPPKHRAKWLRELKRIRDITIQEIADQAEVATATVEKLLAGDEIKDIKVSTLAHVSYVLIGSAGQHPCSLASEESVVFLTKSISEKDNQIKHLQNTIDHIHEAQNQELESVRKSYDASYTKELQEVRSDCKAKIDYLRAELEKKDRLIETLLSKL